MSKFYLMISVAIISNILAVYFMKLSSGITTPWPTLGMLISNLLTLWFLSSALASGANVGGAVTMLTVGVMIGSFFVGALFGDRITVYQGCGALIAIIGVVVGNLAVVKTP